MKNNIDKSNLSLRIAYVFESILAMVVLLAVFLGTIDVLRMIWDAYIVDFQNPVEYTQLNNLLGQILLLVIGVELVVMLSLHLPGA
ncbi:MAG: phosphate-starvation-inducible PsiE family protein, partial [Peptostreptococcaceae bacterium]|nr:phosphate-starvation-inducible PsiE family protein [Peptostreptococcaceae bacterium]